MFKNMFNSNFKKNDKERGFIQVVLIAVGALVLLKYIYNIDIVGFLTQGKFKEWLDKSYNIATLGWERYSMTMFKVWDYFIEFVKNLATKIK